MATIYKGEYLSKDNEVIFASKQQQYQVLIIFYTIFLTMPSSIRFPSPFFFYGKGIKNICTSLQLCLEPGIRAAIRGLVRLIHNPHRFTRPFSGPFFFSGF